MHHFFWRRSRDLFSRDDILEDLRTALERASNGPVNLDELHEDSRIIEDIGLASLDLLELRCEMEEKWSINCYRRSAHAVAYDWPGDRVDRKQINKPG